MLYVLIGMSLLFVAIGFTVTEKNAKYLLSGYNTMGKAGRKKFDIKAYILFFRNFHIFLGISLLILGVVTTCTINENTGGIFIVLYPIIAYLYFLLASSRFSTETPTKRSKVRVIILMATLIFVAGLLAYGFQENKLAFDPEKIEIRGIYGETIPRSKTQSIELVNNLPTITLRSNGFALGSIHKGFFRTNEGKIVKLILNSDNKPYLLITKTNGKKIYFSAKKQSNAQLLNDIKTTLPDVLYK